MESDYCKKQVITYLGNKRKMVPMFDNLFSEIKKPFSFLDGFSGSGIISRLAKTQPHITNLYANDWEQYSYVLNSCYLQNVDTETQNNISLYTKWLNDTKLSDADNQQFLIYKNYTPADDNFITENDRVYFTSENGKIIDRIRGRIQRFREHDQYYFLAPLIYESSIHNNTCGYFNSFYKHNGIGQFGGKNKNDLGRICGQIHLDTPIFYNNESCSVQVTCSDIFNLLPNLYTDVTYYDPPYNKHPYGTYYFLLNEICEWDTKKPIAPNHRGQDQNWKRSPFNSFVDAKKSFERLIEKTNSQQIWISYNSGGIVSIPDIQKILEKYGTVEKKEFTHATYHKLLGQGYKFREKDVPVIRENFFILHRKK